MLLMQRVQHLLQEPLRARMRWLAEKLCRRRGFQNVPAVDKDNPVGDFPGKLHLVGHHDHRDPAVGEGFHHKQHFTNHLGIECRRRLVKENDLR